MQKGIPIGIALILTACGSAAIVNSDTADAAAQKQRRSAPSRPQVGFEDFSDRPGGMAGCFDPRLTGAQRRAAIAMGGRPCDETSAGNDAAAGQGGDDWSGRYQGQFDGGRGTVTISAQGGNAYRVEIGTVGQGTGCSGGIGGVARAQGNRLDLIVRNNPQLSQGGQCRVSMTRQGARLTVSEDNCLEHHGMSCNFEGNVARIGGAAAQTMPRRAYAVAEPSWIVGAWVLAGEGYCGGEGFVVNADGSYADEFGSGRWSLAGNTLTITMTHRRSGDDEIPVGSPRATRSQILRHDLGTFSIRSPNGSVSNLVRCR